MLDRTSYQEYRNLLKKTKQARVGQNILSGIQEPTEEDEAGKIWTDHLIRNTGTEEDEAGKSWTDNIIRNTGTY